MPDITQIPAPRVPIIDQQTGLMSREWYRFFVNLFSLTGSGTNTVSLEDVQVGPPPMDLGEVKSLFVAASPTTSVQYNDAGNFAGNANFTYDVGTNTVSFGNITGSELPMTIQPRAPTVFEDAGTLTFKARNAVKANSNGGNLLFESGQLTGTGGNGSITLQTPFGATSFVFSDSGLQLTDPTNTTFSNANGNWEIGGPSAPTVDLPLRLFAGINVAATGNNPIEIETDSGTVFEVGESTFGTQEIAFFGATPVVQAAAYTQTFSTASRTVSNPTFTNLVTTAATNVTPYGFTTAAQADAIATKVNQLAADVVILRQLINSLIDDAQAYGLAQ